MIGMDESQGCLTSKKIVLQSRDCADKMKMESGLPDSVKGCPQSRDCADEMND